MKQIVLDFETYYDREYSLRKMTPVEYILDPRFECIGCAIKEGDDPPFWVTSQGLRQYLAGQKEKLCIISHNALFDMCVLAWRFDYTPALMIDTMGMARAMVGHKVKSLALALLARFFKLGDKGTTVHKVEGMRTADIQAAGFYDEYAEYSKWDAELCWGIYRALIADGYPAGEVAIMDTVLRCAVLPKFYLDGYVLAEHLHDVKQGKELLLSRVLPHLTKEDLMSNDKFADALRSLGVEPPTKISLTTGKETYAFAKTDKGLMELEEHDDPDVQALVAARLGIKSTIEETRTERFIAISNLTWPGNEVGRMPVPLRYSGAHTHRLSGDWKLNLQNLGRGSKLRKSLKAPKGKKVVAVDASQIEARLAGWFCGASDLVNAFAAKEDVYSSFASDVFGYEVLKATHPIERFIGKTGVLGLQYGLGWLKFQSTVAMQSKAQVGKEVVLDDVQASRVVQTYRNKYREIPQMWSRLNSLIPRMTGVLYEEVGPVTFLKQSIRLPSGLALHYHDLECRDGEWWFTYGGTPKRVYGGKLLENITQALARICVMDTAIAIRKETGLDLALQVHDELVYVVDEKDAEPLKDLIIEKMRTPPSWGAGLPLDAEGAVGDNYGECK